MKKLLVLFLCGLLLGTHGPLVAVAATTSAITSNGVFIHTNVQRYRAGVPFLTVDPQLSQIALRKMQDLFARQYFAHEAPTGEEVGDLAKMVGYEYLTVGENLALGDFLSSKHVVEAWMDSPGHRANILATKFNQIGIAAGRGKYDGRTVWIVVQTFGMPRTACPIAYLSLEKDIRTLDARITFLKRIADVRKEAAEETGLSRSEYIERVNSYNRAVDVYNTNADEYRELLATYNEGVRTFNACLKEKSR